MKEEVFLHLRGNLPSCVIMGSFRIQSRQDINLGMSPTHPWTRNHDLWQILWNQFSGVRGLDISAVFVPCGLNCKAGITACTTPISCKVNSSFSFLFSLSHWINYTRLANSLFPLIFPSQDRLNIVGFLIIKRALGVTKYRLIHVNRKQSTLGFKFWIQIYWARKSLKNQLDFMNCVCLPVLLNWTWWFQGR